MNRQPVNSVSPHSLWGGAALFLLKGTALALLFSVVMLFIAALLLYFTALPEKTTPYMVFAISLLAILTGSSYACKRIGVRGWLYGGIVGVIYVLLVLISGLIFLDDFGVAWNFITKLFLGFVFGAAGGMWGVNR